VKVMFWSFALPAMPLDTFRIVHERMLVLELLCSGLTIFAWQAGAGIRPNIKKLANALTLPWARGIIN
jgi:hypothetical protein